MTDQMKHILQIPLLLKWKQITLPPLHRHSIMNNLQNMFLLRTCITVVLMEHGLSCNPWKSSNLHELQQKGRLTLDAVVACLVIWKSNLHASSVSQYSGCSLTCGMKVGNPCIVHSPSLSPPSLPLFTISVRGTGDILFTFKINI